MTLSLQRTATSVDTDKVSDSLPRRALGGVREAVRSPLPERGAVAKGLIRTERWLARVLERHVLAHAGLHWIYDRQLDRGARLVEGSVSLPDLPQAWQGRRLLLISDLHAGPYLSARALDRLLGKLSETEPDVVAIAGDFVAGSVHEVEMLAAGLRRFGARTPILGVLGNHDHYTEQPARLAERLGELGVEILHNRGRRLLRDGQPLEFLGIDDWNAGDPDLELAVAATPRSGPRILLSHVPDSFFAAVDRRVDLVLSGHTHGGQIRIPGGAKWVRLSRYSLVAGHYAYRSEDGFRGQLVLSQGLGVVGVPARFRCPPEATLLTLRDASRSQPPRNSR